MPFLVRQHHLSPENASMTCDRPMDVTVDVTSILITAHIHPDQMTLCCPVNVSDNDHDNNKICTLGMELITLISWYAVDFAFCHTSNLKPQTTLWRLPLTFQSVGWYISHSSDYEMHRRNYDSNGIIPMKVNDFTENKWACLRAFFADPMKFVCHVTHCA